MKLCILTILFTGLELIFIDHCESATHVYYVKPTEDAECPGHPCETLQYYLDTHHNGSMAIEFQNTTLILLNGTHTIKSKLASQNNFVHAFRSTIKIKAQKNHLVFIEVPEGEEYHLRFILQGSSLYMENLNLLGIISIGVYDCSTTLLPSIICDCSLHPDWYDCLSYYAGELQLSSVNLCDIKFEISVSKQACFDNINAYRSFIIFMQADTAIFYNTWFWNS